MKWRKEVTAMLSGFKKTFAFILAVVLILPMLAVLPLSVAALSITADSDVYDIDVLYSYPVARGSEEWTSLKSHAERVAVCQIPESILSRLTTEALLETVLNYPLLVDMFLWSSIDEGIYSLRSSFNGMDELMKRSDLENVLSARSVASLQANSNAENRDASSSVVKTFALGIIEGNIYGTTLSNARAANVGTPVTVYTPAGTAVSAIRDATYTLVSDYTGNIANHIAEFEEEIALSYPNIVKVANADPSYNCHSYAWYGEGNASNIYIQNPWAYMNDGSYDIYVAPQGWTMVCYRDMSRSGAYQYIHSAIMNPQMVCHSKFGYFGLYRHALDDCPYYEQADSITYWKLNPAYA